MLKTGRQCLINNESLLSKFDKGVRMFIHMEGQKVIREVYDSFCDCQKYPTMQLRYMWTRLRCDLDKSDLFRTDWNNWNAYIDGIDNLIPDKNPAILYYLIVDSGEVYETTLSEIKKMLYEYPKSMEDFYLVSTDYKWLIIHCDDGECMFRVSKR